MKKTLEFFNRITGLMIFLILVIVLISHFHRWHHGRYHHWRDPYHKTDSMNKK